MTHKFFPEESYLPPFDKNTSSLFGLFEGKAKAAKLAAQADADAKREAAKQQTLLMEALAAKNGYTPAADAAQAAVDQENAKSKSEIILYVVLAVIVVAVMAGIYFIRKR
jgi:cobalamin biosynthesis Mg chelatase CobN